ncbi:MAG: carbon-nitrogen hydrolase family protein [Proteobacteria bacterium]|nr:carbon-nitrogen hydrolase family protein [Pseudomonadota bacterium]
MQQFLAFAVQFDIDDSTSDRPAPWSANIERASKLIDQAALRHGPPKLVVLPAYAVTGIPQAMATGPADAGREFSLSDAEPLKELARRFEAYVVAGAVEYDAAESQWWNAAYIFDPSGEIVLHYRQVHAAGQPGLSDAVAPSAEIEIPTAIPVFDTEIGRLGCAIGIDALSPELARALTFNGAEIVCHLTDEPPTFYRDGARQVRSARAWENTPYWIAADHGHGGTTEIIGPDARNIAASLGVRYSGTTIAWRRRKRVSTRAAMNSAWSSMMGFSVSICVHLSSKDCDPCVPMHAAPIWGLKQWLPGFSYHECWGLSPNLPRSMSLVNDGPYIPQLGYSGNFKSRPPSQECAPTSVPGRPEAHRAGRLSERSGPRCRAACGPAAPAPGSVGRPGARP